MSYYNKDRPSLVCLSRHAPTGVRSVLSALGATEYLNYFHETHGIYSLYELRRVLSVPHYNTQLELPLMLKVRMEDYLDRLDRYDDGDESDDDGRIPCLLCKCKYRESYLPKHCLYECHMRETLNALLEKYKNDEHLGEFLRCSRSGSKLTLKTILPGIDRLYELTNGSMSESVCDDMSA